ncbi:MAG: hypothetical protein J1F32_04010 [Erysipelotrichales bacterium]|nr:hypothetical protein [Erysipelotrichales bacterium]
MSNKLKGTLLGLAASLGGVALWILLYVGLGVVAGIAAILMGVLFIIVYSKINPADTSKFKYIIAGVASIVEIVVAELICVAILCAEYNLSLSAALENNEVMAGIAQDVIFGVVFAAIGLGGYIFSKNRKTINTSHKRVKTGTAEEKSADEEVKEDKAE